MVLLTNTEEHGALHEISAKLVAALLPTPGVPKVTGPDAAEVAKELFKQLQAGSRSRLGGVSGAALRLAPWGDPLERSPLPGVGGRGSPS